MKPRSEWGPADETVHTFSTTALILVGCLLLGALGYGVAIGVGEKIREYKHDVAWNKRGKIHCDGEGHLDMSNIDFSGTWSGPAIDMEIMQKNCQPASSFLIQTYR